MKTIILTEKPSVAADFAKALHAGRRKNGYFESEDHIITWAVGHLLELLEPEDYDPRWRRWHLSTLPIIPDDFRYKAIPKTEDQLQVIRRLLTGNPPQSLVVATDAGREGEVIARTILMECGVADSVPARRFWTSQALTPDVIRNGMAAARPAADYDRLWRAGQARQIADWLVGMNGTRAASRHMNDLFSVGRVQTAVLALLVDRRRERECFTPEPFWVLKALFANDKGQWWGGWFAGDTVRFREEAAALSVASEIAGASGVVVSAKRRKRTEPPPLLYSLTELQRDANKKYGFSAQTTLSLAQALYERDKCLSYPRTDSAVLGTQNVGLVREIMVALRAVYPDVFAGITDRRLSAAYRRVFDDSRLTDHHAIIPLAPCPDRAIPDERKIYDQVLRRFAAAFHPDCEFEQTEIITRAARHSFRTRGKQILSSGWRAVYTEPEPDRRTEEMEDIQILPDLHPDDPAEVKEIRTDRRMTQPPPEYTEASLLKDMTQPGRYVTEEALKKIYRGDVGLGTQATRAQIIETLLARRYVVRRKKALIAEDKGCLLIDTLRSLPAARGLASPEETARWEMELDRIARGEDTGASFINNIKEWVKGIVNAFKDNSGSDRKKEILGVCPQCGGDVVEGPKAYGCVNWRTEDGGCRFAIWKTIAQRDVTADMAKALMNKQKIGPFQGFISRKGTPFSGSLKLEQEDGQWRVKFDFSTGAESRGYGKCPRCGGTIIEGKKGYGCANWREADGGCRFVIWKTLAQKELPVSVVRMLLENGITDPIEGFVSNQGNTFTARLKLENSEEEGVRVVFDSN